MAEPQDGLAYVIMNSNGRTVLHLEGGSKEDNARVSGNAFIANWVEDEWKNQIWHIKKTGEKDRPLFNIQNHRSKTFLDLANGSKAEGTGLACFGETHSDTQKWHFSNVDVPGVTRYQIYNYYASKNTVLHAVDLEQGGTANGTKAQVIQMSIIGRNPNQDWVFIQIDLAKAYHGGN